MSRLPPPPPVPAEAQECCATVPPPDVTGEILAELAALRAGLRDLCRGPACECCGAPYGEPGLWCNCELPPCADYEMF